ncbi:hypothetical protein OF83DRAFT_1177691 [Amylostereum chailletii]|nr:hypothetical protein OF83DRAFT_1177691 [Amylostereum chailletii]
MPALPPLPHLLPCHFHSFPPKPTALSPPLLDNGEKVKQNNVLPYLVGKASKWAKKMVRTRT